MKNYYYKDINWIRIKYCDEKLSVNEIAEKCNISRDTIYNWIKKFELVREEILRKRSKNRYSLNEKYFENIDNSNKAYWLGFIAADGCVFEKSGNRIFYIELSRKDRVHLEKFKDEIKYEGPIYDLERKKNGLLSSKIHICSCYFVKYLVEKGICQNKTKILKRPNIDKKYFSHWIRGFFDGDGSISLVGKTLKGQFFSSSLDVMQFIVENIPGTNTITVSKKGIGFYHSFGGNGISKKIYDYLYKDSNISLSRKKEVFLRKIKENIT